MSTRCAFYYEGADLPPNPVVHAIKKHLDLEASVGGYEAAHVECSAVLDIGHKLGLIEVKNLMMPEICYFELSLRLLKWCDLAIKTRARAPFHWARSRTRIGSVVLAGTAH